MFAMGRAVPGAGSFLLVAGRARTTRSPIDVTTAWEGVTCGQGWVHRPCAMGTVCRVGSLLPISPQGQWEHGLEGWKG